MTNGSKAVVTGFNGRTACFYLENNKVTELFFEESTDFKTGDIVIVRVSNVRTDLNAAFVEIKPGVTGFLPLEKGWAVPKQGDEFPALITAEAQKSKPASLSRDLSIHGLYAVSVSDSNKVMVSSKLSSEEKERLKASAESLDLKTGIIIRTSAVNAGEEELKAEIVRLSDKLHEILQSAGSRTVFSRVYEAKPAFYERIEECRPDEIVTDDPVSFDKLNKFTDPTRVSFYKDKAMSLAVLYGLSKMYSEAVDKKVNLKTGGFLYIEPTEALTVIDVNSGKIDKTKSKDILVKETNFEAAKEVFRQLRLRNLSGIIIIDFINFTNASDKEELSALMKELSRKDPVKTSFVDFTELGLAEITRQKKYKSLYS
ncbi:MAG: ribonuclease E/G [Lachnospiraceae bacterium]|nr:ribonuclease E/G [Lachnospiraceae bacterium]